MRIGAGVVVVIALALALVSDAAAERAWQPPADPPTPTAEKFVLPSFVVTDRDETVLAFNEVVEGEFPTAFATWADPNGVFSAPQRLGERAYGPVVTADRGGGTLVAWEFFKGGGPFQRTQRILVAARPARGSFDAPKDLGQGQSGIAMDANGAGHAAVLWVRYGGHESDTRHLYTNIRQPDGTWGPPESVSGEIPENIIVYSHEVAVTPDGGAYFVYVEPQPGAGDVVKAAYRPPGGPVGSPHLLSDSNNWGFAPHLATDGRGGAAFTWTEAPGEFAPIGTLHVATAEPGGAFRASATLGGQGAFTFNGAPVAATDAGEVLVAYDSGDVSQNQGGPPRAAFGSTVTGAFGAPVDLDTVASEYTRATMSPAGEALVVYRTSPAEELRSVRRPAGGSFGSPQVLLCPSSHTQPLAIALGPGGDGRALWEEHGVSVAHFSAEAQAAAPNPPSCPPPPSDPVPTPPPPPVGLTVGHSFRLTPGGSLTFTTECYTRCRVTAAGSLRVEGVRGKLKIPATRGPAIVGRATAAIKLPHAVRLRVARALARRDDVSGRLWVSARSKAGLVERGLVSGPVRRAKRKTSR